MDCTDNDSASTTQSLDALEGHCRSKSSEIVAAVAYQHLVGGDLGLPEYIDKCRGHNSMQFWSSL